MYIIYLAFLCVRGACMHSIYAVEEQLKQAARSPYHRLHSIAHDARFVEQVQRAYALPLIANERCGSWYVPPSRLAHKVCFKSTDGHAGTRTFSLRRLNLHLLDVIQVHGGAIVVDSTRHGKRIPDALSKTIPIWAAVINRCNSFHTQVACPAWAVSAQEQAGIQDDVEKWTEDFASLGVTPLCLDKPIQLVYATTWMPLEVPCSEAYTLVLLTASMPHEEGTRIQDFTYVQGAADDQESWTGLTATSFWKNKDDYLSMTEHELHVALQGQHDDTEGSPLFQVCHGLYLGRLPSLPPLTKADCVLHLGTGTPPTSEATCMCIPLGRGKAGSRRLRASMPRILAAMEGWRGRRIFLVGDDGGGDLAAAVAVAYLCCEQGTRSKLGILQQLARITTLHPSISPSRASLNAVRSFLVIP